jgi:LuxR family quorum-sensing system transcriptional regulator CciR
VTEPSPAIVAGWAENLAVAQLVVAFAFEAARRLVKYDAKRLADPARFSDQERDCLIWVARGKSDSEIATILGISPERFTSM